ncbi:hypothetical protein GPL17_37340 [Bradyrhizobium yuanmingense]|nr:hypothetical protein [Bradyrhizobium yuanmingense]
MRTPATCEEGGWPLRIPYCFANRCGCPSVFCDPQSPWQRGSNENTNGLARAL